MRLLVNRLILGKSAFTLVEMIIYTSILLILIAVLSSILTTSLEIQSYGEASSNITQDGRYIIARLKYDLARASQVVLPADFGQTSSSLQILVGGVNYIYDLDTDGNLRLTDEAGTDNLNGSQTQIKNLSFEKVGNVGGRETVTIVFTVESRRGDVKGEKEKIFRTTIGLR